MRAAASAGRIVCHQVSGVNQSMNRFAAASLLLTAALFAGCADAPTAARHLQSTPASHDVVSAGILDGANAASMQLSSGDHFSMQIPTQFHAQNPCAGGRFGEIVVFTGNQHLVFGQTMTGGGHVTTSLHWNADDVTGLGQYTGFTYRATGVSQDHSVSNASLPYTDTYVNNYHIIGQGQATNMTLHETVHVTIDANGLLTAWVTDYDLKCEQTPTF
jgi:hypothetical protein